MRSRFVLTVVLLLSAASLPALAQNDQRQWGRPHPPETGACFYKESYFRGDYFCMKEGEQWSTLPYGFNDRISSIRLFRGARVYVFNDGNFGGMSLRITSDVEDLKRIGLADDPHRNWNDRISSIAINRENDDRDRRHQ